MPVFRISLFSALILLTAGQAEGQADKTTSSQTTKVTAGVSPATSTAGIFFAEELGFFKEEKLEVTIQVFPSSTAPMIPLLATGELDVGGGNLTAGLFNVSPDSNDGILLVADKGSVRKDFDYIKLMIRKDLLKSGQYKSLKDLKGLRVGFTALGGTSQEATFALFLAKAGLSTKDVTIIKSGYADANKAFAAKALDAFVQIEPYVSDAERMGVAEVVEGVFQIHPNQQSAALFFSSRFAKERRDVAVRFMRAYIRGIRRYLEAFGPGRTPEAFERGVSILTKWTSVKDKKTYETMIPAGLDPDGKLNLSSIQSDVRYYLSQGYLKKEPDFKKLVDTSIAEEAVRGLQKR